MRVKKIDPAVSHMFMLFGNVPEIGPNQVCKPVPDEVSHDGATHHPCRTRHQDLIVLIHNSSLWKNHLL